MPVPAPGTVITGIDRLTAGYNEVMGRQEYNGNGFDVKNIDGYAGVVEYGDPDNPDTLGILGHLDIVPLGEGWTKQPLALTVNDGSVDVSLSRMIWAPPFSP